MTKEADEAQELLRLSPQPFSTTFLLGHLSVALKALPSPTPKAFLEAESVEASTGWPGIWPAMRVGQRWANVSADPQAAVRILALYPFEAEDLRATWGGLVAYEEEEGTLAVAAFSMFGVGSLLD